MTKKTILLSTTLVLFLSGILIAFLPFVSSLRPTARAEAALTKLDISALSPGTYTFFEDTTQGEWQDGWRNGYLWSVLIYRRENGEVRAWQVLTKNGLVAMPYYHWWEPSYSCLTFGPAVINGVVDESQPITCKDPAIPYNDYWQPHWQWDITGKNLLGIVDDLMVRTGSVQGDFFVLGKPSN